ncbi:hypothetical protein GPSY_2374 [Paraglaciecola psychrophila 170]|nr:hypothetical protein GPSY_2374 [Paraglaciecola psychrophila 170]
MLNPMLQKALVTLGGKMTPVICRYNDNHLVEETLAHLQSPVSCGIAKWDLFWSC